MKQLFEHLGKPSTIFAVLVVAATSWGMFTSCRTRDSVPNTNAEAMPGSTNDGARVDSVSNATSERQPVVYRISYGNALSATMRYYMVYGRWPGSWEDVRTAGLCLTETRTPAGRPVDPDDGSLDFDDDFIFQPPLDGKPPHLVLRLDASESGIIDQAVPTPLTYSDVLGRLEEGNPGYDLVNSYLSDPARLTQWAIAGQLTHRIQTFRYLKGRFPKTLDEFLASGMAVVDTTSINPLTGRTYAGDGSANDFYYEYIDDEVTPTIHPMDADGEPCRIQINY